MRADLTLMNETLHRVFKLLHYPIEVMLVCVRWYVAYPLRVRHLEVMMAERGITVDHSTTHRWVIKMLPVLTAMPKTQAASRQKLVHGQNVHQGCRPMEIVLPGC